MGRPPIPLEPHLDRLVEAIRLGATYELAARYAGVSADTFARWRTRAATARPGTPLATLRDRLADAEGQAALGWLALLDAADDWHAAAWLLERRYPACVHAAAWLLERRYPETYGGRRP